LLKMKTNIVLLELLEEEKFTNFWIDVEIVIVLIKLYADDTSLYLIVDDLKWNRRLSK
jgi:hypothetical protein